MTRTSAYNAFLKRSTILLKVDARVWVLTVLLQTMLLDGVDHQHLTKVSHHELIC